MTTFGLIHGAGHGAWCWERLAPIIRAAGHAVVAPDLPTEDGTAGATRYAALALEALRDHEDVVLVGHSLGGLTIPLVAAARPIRHLVYLCALMPRPGLVPFGEDPGAPPSSEPGLTVDAVEGGFRFPDAIARSYLYNRCSPADASWAVARLRTQSRAPHDEVCPLDALPAVPATYVAGTHDRCVVPSYGAWLARTRLGQTVRLIEADHSPFLSATTALAALLLGLAQEP